MQMSDTRFQKTLPLEPSELENFILHHIHLWSVNYYNSNDGDNNDAIPPLWEVMDTEFSSFYVKLADKFRCDVLPKFLEAYRDAEHY